MATSSQTLKTKAKSYILLNSKTAISFQTTKWFLIQHLKENILAIDAEPLRASLKNHRIAGIVIGIL